MIMRHSVLIGASRKARRRANHASERFTAGRPSVRRILVVLSVLLGSMTLPSAASRSPARAPHAASVRGQRDGCRRELVPPGRVPGRPIDVQSLARTRDIGMAGRDIGAEWRSIGVSPDGRRAAFQITRGDLRRNVICWGMMVVSLDGAAEPRLIDDGTELIPLGRGGQGYANFPSGGSLAAQPQWSPDGRRVSYLKRTAGRTQVWTARSDGHGAVSITSLPGDVERFAFAASGFSVIVAWRPGLAAAEAALSEEARSGFVYDERAFPLGTVRPLPLDVYRDAVEVLDLRSGRRRPAKAAEIKHLDGTSAGIPQWARWVAKRASAIAWAEPEPEGVLQPYLRVHATLGGHVRRCSAAECLGDVQGIWWQPGTDAVTFSRTDGFGGGIQSFYRWHLATDRVERVAVEDALYTACTPSRAELICLQETPISPGRIIAFDPASGRRRVIFDPNPELAGGFKGSVERVTWTDRNGLSNYGRIILPPAYTGDRPLPLVVVQYRPRGFQRGGVGDEVPIFPLANAGFAVFHFNRPDPIDTNRTLRSTDAYMRSAMTDWKDERDTLVSLETAVRQLIGRGIVDEKRIGISGLSAGSQTTQFGLIHSSLFAAAAMGTCCKDPLTWMVTAGPRLRAQQQRWGLEPLSSENAPQWRAVSLAMNVDRIRTPILLQLPEWEYRVALETVTAFRAHRRPIDVIVFPAEFHVKVQPAHRLAVYQRNMDWFDFWLRGRERAEPDAQAQYRRWRELQTAATP